MTNNIILSTDLDRTMIYSKVYLNKKTDNHICVEQVNNEDWSYITNKMNEYINNILNDQILSKRFVPVTTRTIKQFQRIELFNKFPYAITSNGGNILINGIPDETWSNLLEEKKKNLRKDYNEIHYLLEENFFGLGLLTQEIKLVDNLFYYTKVEKRIDESQKTRDIIDKLSKLLENSDWTYTLQGLKLYVIPKYISKSRAINYLIYNILKLPSPFIISSGDGRLDVDMLTNGSLSYIPINTEAYRIISKELKINSTKYRILENTSSFPEEVIEKFISLSKEKLV